jgi:hypothetical protein
MILFIFLLLALPSKRSLALSLTKLDEELDDDELEDELEEDELEEELNDEMLMSVSSGFHPNISIYQAVTA